MFLAMTSSTKLRTRSKDSMSYAEVHLPGSITSGKEESGEIVGGHFSGALPTVGIVRMSKALFTILDACGATRTASVTGGLVQALSGTPDEGSNFGHPSFARWIQHGIQGAEFLDQLTVHRGEAGDCRLQLPGGPFRTKRSLLRLSADLVGLFCGFREDLFGLGLAQERTS